MKRRPVDSWFWELYVQACGAQCCACNASGVKLERGHIVAHAFGGTDDLDNLIPLCPPCNKKYLKKETPDNRPGDWRERFFLLLGHVLRPQISVSQAKGLCNLIPATKQTENNTVVDWKNPEFVACTEVFTQSGNDKYRDAKAALRELVSRSQKLEPRPKRPTAKRQERLLALTLKFGVEALRIAGEEFLRDMPWVLDERHGNVAYDSWLHLCDSFEDYLADGHARAKRVEEEAREQRVRDLAQAKATEIARRKSRWAEFKRAADVPHWPGMREGDAEVIAAVAAAGTEVQDVTEERLEESRDVSARYKIYGTEELCAAKQKLRDDLTQCVQWLKRFNAAVQAEYAPRIKGLRDWIDGVKDIETLREDAWPIRELLEDLDPSHPEFDPETMLF